MVADGEWDARRKLIPRADGQRLGKPTGNRGFTAGILPAEGTKQAGRGRGVGRENGSYSSPGQVVGREIGLNCVHRVMRSYGGRQSRASWMRITPGLRKTSTGPDKRRSFLVAYHLKTVPEGNTPRKVDKLPEAHVTSKPPRKTSHPERLTNFLVASGKAAWKYRQNAVPVGFPTGTEKKKLIYHDLPAPVSKSLFTG